METNLDTDLYPLTHILALRLQYKLNYKNNYHIAMPKDYFVAINAQMSFEKKCSCQILFLGLL